MRRLTPSSAIPSRSALLITPVRVRLKALGCAHCTEIGRLLHICAKLDGAHWGAVNSPDRVFAAPGGRSIDAAPQNIILNGLRSKPLILFRNDAGRDK